MNLFKIPKTDPEVAKRMARRIAIVMSMALVCFFASLVVRFFINERINDARVAFKGIDQELPILYVQDIELLRNESNQIDLGDNSNEKIQKVYASGPGIKILISSLNQKTLGKQKFVSFDSDVSVSENFLLPENTKLLFIKIPVFSGVSVSNFNTEVFVDNVKTPLNFTFVKDLEKFNDKDESYYYAQIPQGFAGKNITINASWITKGSRSIYLTEGKYDLTINTDWKNIRLKGSNYGKIEKTENSKNVIFNIDSSYNPAHYSGFDGVDYKYAGLDFMASIDDINLTDRVTKYASLVILLTFFMIFILDVRRKFIANILQYVIVGISLCLFYLLNLSLGEYTGFTVSYAIATIVTILMNGWYISNVFSSKKYGIITAVGLTIVYSVIYWLIRAESINLLAGTLILYIVLIILMINTAKINKVSSS